MRIDDTMPSFHTQIPERSQVERNPSQVVQQQQGALPYPGIVVNISPEGMAAYNKSKEAGETSPIKSIAAMDFVCETCNNRRYQDGSDDSSVSFQTATKLNPGEAASLVRAHEYEHVSNEQQRADEEGREVISQTVTIETSICPECGRVYVSGGKTKTVTAEKNNVEAPKNEA